MLTAILILAAFAIAAAVYDVTMTRRGLRAGVAVESNAIIVALGGPRPSALVLYLESLAEIALAVFVALVPNPALHGIGLASLAVLGVKHIQGGREWRYLLLGKSLPVLSSAWEKFLGVWV